MYIEVIKSADVKEYFSNLESIKLIDCENMMFSITETVKRKFDAFKELVKISKKECVLDKENSVYNEYFYEHYVPKIIHCQKELLDYIHDCEFIKIYLRGKLCGLIENKMVSIGLDYSHPEFDRCFNNIYDTTVIYNIKKDINCIFAFNLNCITIKKRIRDLVNYK